MNIKWIVKRWWLVALIILIIGGILFWIGVASINYQWDYFNQLNQPWYIIFSKHTY